MDRALPVEIPGEEEIDDDVLQVGSPDEELSNEVEHVVDASKAFLSSMQGFHFKGAFLVISSVRTHSL